MSTYQKNENGYLVHSKGPWKNHKYLSKIGNKYIYAKGQVTNGIHGFGARLRKKIGFDARDEFYDRSNRENFAVTEYNMHPENKGYYYRNKDMHARSVNAYDKYRKTLAGKIDKVVSKATHPHDEYYNMDYWEPAKTSLSARQRKKVSITDGKGQKHKATITGNAQTGKGFNFKKNSALTEAAKQLNKKKKKR